MFLNLIALKTLPLSPIDLLVHEGAFTPYGPPEDMLVAAVRLSVVQVNLEEMTGQILWVHHVLILRVHHGNIWTYQGVTEPEH